MNWTQQVRDGAPFALAIALSIGIVVLTLRAVRREHRGAPVRIDMATLLPLAIVCFFLSPLVASLVTPDWSPWTMGGSTLIMWAGTGFSAVYLWRERKGESESRAARWGIAVGVLPPLLFAALVFVVLGS